MLLKTRKERLFLVLGGFFITNALLAEMIGGKLINFGPIDLGFFQLDARVMSIGILPWPVVFLTTDLINEYYGREGVKKLTWLTSGLIMYLFVMLFFAMQVGASREISPVQDEEFRRVFGQSLWIIVGSITAFVTSQFLDVAIFWLLRKRTGKKMLWLRATGSTVVSQVADTLVVGGIGFYLPGKLNFADYIDMSLTGYIGKLLIALALTPAIYLGHNLVERYLGNSAERTVETAASESLDES